MISTKNITRLLSLPVLWMGLVQLSFGLLSFFVFQDNVGKAFIEPALVLILVAIVFLYRLKKSDNHDVSFRDALVFTLLLMATGLDFWSAFTAVAACINVLGPGFGEVGSNFIPVTDTGIWLLNAAMILGRLEYFTILAMLTPAFWRY